MNETIAGIDFKAPFRVVAIIAAHNEGDVIHHVVANLIENGVEVYLIDNASTDDTVSQATPFLGRGLIHIERFPEESGRPADAAEKYYWIELLRRKEEVALALGADWYLHADADEFRLGPWADLTLAQAFRVVDAHGYNAVNFDLYNFRPTDDRFPPGDDVRKYLRQYEPAKDFDLRQVKAWRNPGVRVDLACTGGHEVRFAGRRVFPVPFILQHYPIRSAEQGRRKVLTERLTRFLPEERALGWHVQYDAFARGRRAFLWNPNELEDFAVTNARCQAFQHACAQLLVSDELRGFPLGQPDLQREHINAALQRRLASRPSDEEMAHSEQACAALLENRVDAVETCRQLTPRETLLAHGRLEMEVAHSGLGGNLIVANACAAVRRRLAAIERAPRPRTPRAAHPLPSEGQGRSATISSPASPATS